MGKMIVRLNVRVNTDTQFDFGDRLDFLCVCYTDNN